MKKRVKYCWAAVLVFAMVGVAELTGEKEVVFPEVAALVSGMWIVDKQAWRVNRRKLVFLMTLGAVAGICIVRFSPLPFMADMAAAFLFAATALLLSRTTLVPLISACMLPVLFGTGSWVYPVAVLVMSLLVVTGQKVLEMKKMRIPVGYVPKEFDRWRESLKWMFLLLLLLVLAAVPVYSGYTYCILPPLIVTFVEFSNPEAGFRRVPLLIFFYLVSAAVLGAGAQLLLHAGWGLPSAVSAALGLILLFCLFEWQGRVFAPAAAVALVPVIIPQSDLALFPLQVALGAAVFVSVPVLLFQRELNWKEPLKIRCRAVRMYRYFRR